MTMKFRPLLVAGVDYVTVNNIWCGGSRMCDDCYL